MFNPSMKEVNRWRQIIHEGFKTSESPLSMMVALADQIGYQLSKAAATNGLKGHFEMGAIISAALCSGVVDSFNHKTEADEQRTVAGILSPIVLSLLEVTMRAVASTTNQEIEDALRHAFDELRKQQLDLMRN